MPAYVMPADVTPMRERPFAAHMPVSMIYDDATFDAAIDDAPLIAPLIRVATCLYAAAFTIAAAIDDIYAIFYAIRC